MIPRLELIHVIYEIYRHRLPKWRKAKGYILLQANSQYPSPPTWGMSKGQIKSFHRAPCS